MTDQQCADALSALDSALAADPAVGPELFARMLEAERKRGLLHGTRPLCPFLRPYFLPRSRYAQITAAVETLARAFERLVAAALADDRLMAILGVTEREARFARMEPGYARLCVSSRADSFLTETSFKFLEYNAESPAGIGDQMMLDQVLFEVPHVREFIEANRAWRPEPHRRLLEAMLATYRAWGGTKERPLIAIVDWAGVPTESEFGILARYFGSQGYRTVIADPKELSYEGGVLAAAGAPIDILYKRVITHELLEAVDDSHPLLRAYADGRVCMMNSFRSKVAHKKAGFAVMSDPAFASLFTEDQLEVIRRHVPWTRIVREGDTDFDGRTHDMRELVLTERLRLVVKPNDDYGGKNVTVGPSATPEAWVEAVNAAFDSPYVVQEHVPAHRESMPLFEDGVVRFRELTIDFDPFLFDNEVEGGLVRLSSTALSNISSGGSETSFAVFEG